VADTSLIFNVIARDSGVGRVLDRIAGGFRGAGAAAEEALAEAASGTENLDRQIEEATERVRELAEEFERTGDKTLFGKISRERALITQLSKVRNEIRGTKDDAGDATQDVDRLGGIFSRVAGVAGGFGSSLVSAGGSAASMASSIGGLVVLALGLQVFATVAAPALYAFGGAAAAIPAMLSGAIAAIATLKMGLSGLSENWAAMNAPAAGGGGGGGGGAAVDMTPKIRAVEAAQRDVTRSARDLKDAQTALAEAQANVGKAHEVAAERISDLNREYRQAKQDQAEASQSLVEAEQQLRLAQGRGNEDEILKAQMAVDKQRLAVEEAADKTDDLGKEYADAARKGVNGSDEVVEARKREADAQRRVQDAAEQNRLAIQRLGDAQADLKRKIEGATAGGGGLRQELPRIASNAREFLEELKRLKPAFDDLRLDIQQRLFEGLAGKLRILAERWLPALHKGLGGMADMINDVVSTAFDSLSEPEFIENMLTGLEAFTDMLGDIGQAIAGPFIDAWGRLSAASAPVLQVIGEKISGIIIRFSDWIAKMDESGSLDSFMNKAADVLGSIFDIMTSIVRIAGSVISALFGSNLGSTDTWENLADLLDRIADWLAQPDTQAAIQEYINKFMGLVSIVGWFLKNMDEIPGRFQTAIEWFQALPQRAGQFFSQLPGHANRWFSQMVSRIGYWVGYGIGWAVKQFIAMPGRIGNAIRNLPGYFRNISTWLINAVSGLPTRMWYVGRDIVKGIWEGIQAWSSWLWNQTYNFAANIWRGVQDALGISSPSKVMADKVGRWIPAGIAAGMDDNKGAVTDAVARMAKSLEDTTLPIPALGMDEAMANVGGTLTVAARRQRVEVVTRLDVTGQDGEFKKLVRSMARTSNLYQNSNKG
jgi:uncharacterized membrane-anchored protein YhcB (DUF1043 family)